MNVYVHEPHGHCHRSSRRRCDGVGEDIVLPSFIRKGTSKPKDSSLGCAVLHLPVSESSGIANFGKACICLTKVTV